MIDIFPLQAHQIEEARRVIYISAHEVFHDGPTLDESIAIYASLWQLKDIDTYQDSYVGNDGAFLVLCDDGRIIGTGALHRMDEYACEIKRLWLLPAYQQQGLGYRMMQALLDIARAKGYTFARLETNLVYQQRAYQFYLQLGFYEIPHYGDDPEDVSMEMRL
jgi:GNAT superfamily N-acetyltransferase